MTIDKQALREAAEKATPGEWWIDSHGMAMVAHHNDNTMIVFVTDGEQMGKAIRHEDTGNLSHWRNDNDASFIATANPATVLALLDELAFLDKRNAELNSTLERWAVDRAQSASELDDAEKRIAEQSKAASVDSQWKPDVCPITGRRFFMWIEHPSLGYVPTYGGPFDSYTIPTRDSSGEFSCERYDHDLGGWREGECVGLYLIDDDEQCRVCELEERIAELEAREIKPANGEVLVTVAGFTGCGKSAIAGEIEIAMKAIGVPVQWTNGDAEKCMTGADWLTAIEMYKPNVRIVEVNVPRTAGIKVKGE